ncbi:MAG: prolipoprotein diacylglyceryl transferase [Candidatus Levybacteria bacterium]|nr:prolipoprotein diacylglyceryl transferase [Candidatus Levybacteria bacterium]
MDIFPVVVLVFCLLISLFALYLLANDDFVLLRKQVLITKIFDIAFLIFGVSLFSARLFYVLFHFDQTFLSPFVFLLFPYFPGLSLPGGIVGGVLFFFSYSHSAKLPIGRVFDVFSLSLFSALPLGLLMQFLVIKKEFFAILLLFLGVAASIFFFIMFIRSFQKGNFKDGSIGFLSLSCFSLIAFIAEFVGKKENDVLLIGVFLVSAVFFVHQEKPFLKIKNPFKK